jgi:hypothetical protein
MVYPSLQRSGSVRGRGEVVVTHTPSISDACETHAQSVEKSIASLALRFCLTHGIFTEPELICHARRQRKSCVGDIAGVIAHLQQPHIHQANVYAA